jgi:hypothetical protein
MLQFASDEYHVTADDNATAGTPLLTLSARLTSGSEIAGDRIVYQFIAGNEDGCFAIDSRSGVYLTT